MRRSRDERGDDRASRAGFGHAAFDPADVEDARRGHPAVSLDAFAATVGLEPRGSQVFGSFLSTQPAWPEYVFNACRGAMPSGRLGLVAHELYEVEAHNGSVQAAGSFYDVRVTTRTSLLEIGGISQSKVPNEPFAGNAVWIPTTTVHVRAPETNRLPLLRITRSRSFSVTGRNELDHLGLPGFRVLRGTEDPERLAAAVHAAGPWLQTRGDAHVELRVRYGLVALTVNGYRADEQDLRHLVSVADGIAHALAAVTPPPSGAVFNQYGPPATEVRMPPGVPMPHPVLVPQYGALAAHWGLHLEHPAHLLAMAPRCPIPGIASGVMAGNLPATAAAGRLVWFEQGGRTSGSVRGGLITTAAPGASTPLGGIHDPTTDVYVEVAEGLACAWRRQRSQGVLEPEVLLQSTTAALRSVGLAAV